MCLDGGGSKEKAVVRLCECSEPSAASQHNLRLVLHCFLLLVRKVTSETTKQVILKGIFSKDIVFANDG
jgi:hypothetical protein